MNCAFSHPQALLWYKTCNTWAACQQTVTNNMPEAGGTSNNHAFPLGGLWSNKEQERWYLSLAEWAGTLTG